MNMMNHSLTEAAAELSRINVNDCTGGCNEVKLAANAWLEGDNPSADNRLYVAAKTALSKDEACGCHRRDDLLHCVVNALN